MNINKIVFIITASIVSFSLALTSVAISAEKNVTPKRILVMRNNESKDYKDMKIHCRDRYYYIEFDLIDDTNTPREIYLPLEHFIYPLKHDYIYDVQVYIESNDFLDIFADEYMKAKSEISKLINTQFPKIIQKHNMLGKVSANSLRNFKLYDFNGEYRSAIQKVNDDIYKNIIKNNLLTADFIKYYPDYISGMNQRPDIIINEEFNPTIYSIVMSQVTKLIKVLHTNIEIYSIWADSFNNLEVKSFKLLKLEEELKIAKDGYKIRRLVKEMDNESHEWLAAISKAILDDINYRNHLTELKRLVAPEKVPAEEEKRKQKEEDEKNTRDSNNIKQLLGTSGGANKDETGEEEKKNDPERKQKAALLPIIEKIEADFKIIDYKKPKIPDVLATMINFRSLMDKKSIEADLFFEEMRNKKNWINDVKLWYQEQKGLSADKYHYSEIYDFKKKEWNKKYEKN
jgi:hypothetical protein